MFSLLSAFHCVIDARLVWSFTPAESPWAFTPKPAGEKKDLIDHLTDWLTLEMSGFWKFHPTLFFALLISTSSCFLLQTNRGPNTTIEMTFSEKQRTQIYPFIPLHPVLPPSQCRLQSKWPGINLLAFRNNSSHPALIKPVCSLGVFGCHWLFIARLLADRHKEADITTRRRRLALPHI